MSRVRETAFLPAALEVQATVPSPAGRAVLWAVLAFFTLGVLWASLGKVDIVAVARGKVVPVGHSKVVQAAHGGSVTRLHVAEGQPVRKGDVLVELDARVQQADFGRLTAEKAIHQRAAARLEQLLAWLAHASGGTDETASTQDDRLLDGQWREFTERLAVVDRERGVLSAERDAARRLLVELDAVLAIAADKADGYQRLAKKKLLSAQQHLDAEQQRLGAARDRRIQLGRIGQLDARILALDAREAHLRSEFRRQLLESLEERRDRLAVIEPLLEKTRVHIQGRIVTAPIDGVVQQLAVNHSGAVVSEGQQLLVIVPETEPLEIEAALENRDIAFVNTGQHAEIKFDAYPFTRHGLVRGEILGVSRDAVDDPQGRHLYAVRVGLGTATVIDEEPPLTPRPGMAVTVEINTGKRTLISYFLGPLLQYGDESLRER